MLWTSYFILTTLTTIGYGDMFPISVPERIYGIFVQISGVAFFSFIMGKFISIIQSYNEWTVVEDKGIDLHNWLALLTKFTDDKPLPHSLINSIDMHFSHFWKQDRLLKIGSKALYLATLPRTVKWTVMTNYLFKDLFYNFRQFFLTFENRETKFLYEVSFGFRPRMFSKKEIIYEEGDEVSEMYFIT